MAPSHVRWMRRYDVGRLSRVASVKVSARGSLIRSNCSRIHSRVKAKRSDRGRLDEGGEVVEHHRRVDLDARP